MFASLTKSICADGTGKENLPQLFNITDDPMETRDLVHTHAEVVTQMTATLRTALDFPAVALDVADYNQKMHVSISLRKSACRRL